MKVPVGPLVRVEGQEVSIRCDVSNYEGPRDQDFEWNMIQAGKEYQVVSTFDSDYPDAIFKDRVSSGDIRVNKLSDSSAELKIKKARATDSAIYQCKTPSTDTVISGNYFADVTIKGKPEPWQKFCIGRMQCSSYHHLRNQASTTAGWIISVLFEELKEFLYVCFISEQIRQL